MNDKIEVRVPGGRLVATPSYDDEYPGIDVEYVPDNNKRGWASNPSALFEYPLDGQLRLLVWGNTDVEDYTLPITFGDVGRQGYEE